MPFVPGIKRLSQLTIDTAKNWANQKIANLGAPTVAGDSLRKGSAAITDTEIAAANKDGAAGTPSMRTLGAGAQQAAAGNHAHTLAEDVVGNAPTANNATGTTTAGYRVDYVNAYTELSIASKSLTFAATSRAVAIGFIHVQDSSLSFSRRLYMGGVLVTEEAPGAPG
ncbi:MAG: hypothetical protein AAB270_08430, partial [Chloroflexota bacterium]